MLNGVRPSPTVLSELKQFTQKSDVSLANLEVPLTDRTTKTARKSAKELLAKDQWILKADPRHAKYIAEAGIKLVTLANNHAMDYGTDGVSQMISLLDTAGIAHAGAGDQANVANRPAIVTLANGTKVALLSSLAFMTPNALRKATPATLTSGGVSVLSFGGVIGEAAKAKLSRWIAGCRQQADIVVVGLHWGVERKPLPTAYQVTLGRALIDAGADIVWGNHPHVLQGAELYHGHLIMYSMGNLISGLPAHTGLFRVKIDPNGTQALQFIPGYNRGGILRIVKSLNHKGAVQQMRSLCQLLLRRYPSPVSVPAVP